MGAGVARHCHDWGNHAWPLGTAGTADRNTPTLGPRPLCLSRSRRREQRSRRAHVGGAEAGERGLRTRSALERLAAVSLRARAPWLGARMFAAAPRDVSAAPRDVSASPGAAGPRCVRKSENKRRSERIR